MKKKMMKNIINSLTTQPGGFSFRKLTSFVMVILIVYCHFRFVDVTNVVSVLMYDMLFVLLLLGIITADQLYRLKSGGKNDTETNTSQQNNTIPSAPIDNNQGPIIPEPGK